MQLNLLFNQVWIYLVFFIFDGCVEIDIDFFNVDGVLVLDWLSIQNIIYSLISQMFVFLDVKFYIVKLIMSGEFVGKYIDYFICFILYFVFFVVVF